MPHCNQLACNLLLDCQCYRASISATPDPSVYVFLLYVDCFHNYFTVNVLLIVFFVVPIIHGFGLSKRLTNQLLGVGTNAQSSSMCCSAIILVGMLCPLVLMMTWPNLSIAHCTPAEWWRKARCVQLPVCCLVSSNQSWSAM